MLKNRYAVGLNGIVDIQNLSDKTRHDFGPYKCCVCEHELIPKLGKKNIWHFSHKVDMNCSHETYLHQIAIKIFATTFSECINNKKPFYIFLKQIKVCKDFSNLFNEDQCEQSVIRQVDLTKYFNQYAIEKSVNGFKPDILLFSTEKEDTLFVEISVTHPCDQKKIDSGHRILEFQISTEDDLEILKSPIIETDLPNIKTYNFQTKRVPSSCQGNCLREISIFLVYENRKSSLVPVIPKNVNNIISMKNLVHYEVDIYSQPNSQNYKKKVREAHIKNIPISNCYLCKHHGGSFENMPVFCKYLKKGVLLHESLNCEYYRTFSRMEDYIEADKNNSSFSTKPSFTYKHSDTSINEVLIQMKIDEDKKQKQKYEDIQAFNIKHNL